jgi:hypothetical protein
MGVQASGAFDTVTSEGPVTVRGISDRAHLCTTGDKPGRY